MPNVGLLEPCLLHRKRRKNLRLTPPVGQVKAKPQGLQDGLLREAQHLAGRRTDKLNMCFPACEAVGRSGWWLFARCLWEWENAQPECLSVNELNQRMVMMRADYLLYECSAGW